MFDIYFWARKYLSFEIINNFFLGLAGFYPNHPRTYITAWRNRRSQKEAELAKQDEIKEASN